jgi:hypothetical protein
VKVEREKEPPRTEKASREQCARSLFLSVVAFHVLLPLMREPRVPLPATSTRWSCAPSREIVAWTAPFLRSIFTLFFFRSTESETKVETKKRELSSSPQSSLLSLSLSFSFSSRLRHERARRRGQAPCGLRTEAACCPVQDPGRFGPRGPRRGRRHGAGRTGIASR